jgi:hypothetical protein
MSLTYWLILAVILMFGLVVFRGAPYVPTKRRQLEKALDEVYPLTDDDVLVDIGSGDGVVLRAAAARGARAIGYELNPILVLISVLLSRSPLISVRLADFWAVTLPKETTIIYTFGDSRDIVRMYRKAQQTAQRHKKQIYFMSFGFAVPGKKHIKHDHGFYLYIVR